MMTYKAYNRLGKVVAGDAGDTLPEAVRLAEQWNNNAHCNPEMTVVRVSNGSESARIAIQLPLF